ncbi:hypothetical protein [Anaeromyxobacter terrae]|uniref:hypothetical protein n=1 Tax=Anaeromyxobacter terrae TaxID=2925406 RepID=UPI001F574F70|nr:hypothetical protein [Anaeromyxobacter sp. SG22]
MLPDRSIPRTAPPSPSRAGITHRRWPIAAWAAAYLCVAAAIQFGFVSIPFDADTAYHVAVGRLIREHGILHAFPWTPFSWLADHYADKELLFHLLFVPLAGLSWITAAKIVSTILGGVVLLAFYLVLRREEVRYAGAWALLPLALSAVFVFRFALTRPHLLSIALTVLVLWAAARGRLVALAIVSGIFPWAYVAWHLPLVLVAIVEAARLVSGERPRWKPVAVALAGIAAGVALHPNALNLVRFNWIVVYEVLFRNAWGGRPGFSLGQEFEPFTLAQWARWLAAAMAALVAALVLSWRNRREDPAPLAFAIAALAFAALTARTARFAEYFVPLSAMALALSARWVRWRWYPAAVAALAIVYAGPQISTTLQGLGDKQERLPAKVAAVLQARIPPGAQVFTCDWGHTGTLMLALPERRFIVALDPTLAYLKDPESYALWYGLSHDGPPGTAEAIRRSFGARYVICFWEEWNRRFNDRLAFEPGVRTVLFDEFWNVYDLGDVAPVQAP